MALIVVCPSLVRFNSNILVNNIAWHGYVKHNNVVPIQLSHAIRYVGITVIVAWSASSLIKHLALAYITGIGGRPGSGH